MQQDRATQRFWTRVCPAEVSTPTTQRRLADGDYQSTRIQTVVVEIRCSGRLTHNTNTHAHTGTNPATDARRHTPRRPYANAALKILILFAVIFVVDLYTLVSQWLSGTLFHTSSCSHKSQPDCTVRDFQFLLSLNFTSKGRTRECSCRSLAEMPTSDALYPGFTHKSDLFLHGRNKK